VSEAGTLQRGRSAGTGSLQGCRMTDRVPELLPCSRACVQALSRTVRNPGGSGHELPGPEPIARSRSRHLPMSDLLTRKPQDYAFEDWQRLHETDPEAFELRRKEALEAVIQSAPADMQQRLRGVQFRVDMERARAGSDLAACLKAHSMMWDSLVRLRDALSELSDLQKDGMLGAVARTPVEARTATVIPFRNAPGIVRGENEPDKDKH